MKKLNQSEIADTLQITQSEVSQYESCKRFPTKPMIARMAAALGVSRAWLEYGDSGTFDYLIMGQVHEITLWHIEPKGKPPELDKQKSINKIQVEIENLNQTELSIITEFINVLKICRSKQSFLKYQKKTLEKINAKIASANKQSSKSLSDDIEDLRQINPEGYKEIEAIINRYKLKENENEGINEEY